MPKIQFTSDLTFSPLILLKVRGSRIIRQLNQELWRLEEN